MVILCMKTATFGLEKLFLYSNSPMFWREFNAMESITSARMYMFYFSWELVTPESTLTQIESIMEEMACIEDLTSNSVYYSDPQDWIDF